MLRKILAHCSSTAQQTLAGIKGDAPLYAAVIAYTIVGLVLLGQLGRPDMAAHSLYVRQWITLFLIVLPALALLIDTLYVIHRFNDRRRLAFRRAFSAYRMSYLLSGAALMMMLMIFQGTFTSIKNVLPLLRGDFQYDRVQADIDSTLHFGVDPWRILYWFTESDLVRRVLEWNYNTLWFLLCFGALFFVVTSPKARGIRVRYVTMFMLVWVVCGNVLAGLFLSAGPAFYGVVTGDEARFAGIIDFLTRSEGGLSSALAYQNYLWELHISGRAGFASGISAFPSVHVALTAMNAYFLLDRSHRLGVLGFLYVGFIVVSSVYLGWHYAIDGYVSILVVGVMHFACKRLIPDSHSRRFASPQTQPMPASRGTSSAGIGSLTAS